MVGDDLPAPPSAPSATEPGGLTVRGAAPVSGDHAAPLVAARTAAVPINPSVSNMVEQVVADVGAAASALDPVSTAEAAEGGARNDLGTGGDRRSGPPMANDASSDAAASPASGPVAAVPIPDPYVRALGDQAHPVLGSPAVSGNEINSAMNGVAGTWRDPNERCGVAANILAVEDKAEPDPKPTDEDPPRSHTWASPSGIPLVIPDGFSFSSVYQAGRAERFDYDPLSIRHNIQLTVSTFGHYDVRHGAVMIENDEELRTDARSIKSLYRQRIDAGNYAVGVCMEASGWNMKRRNQTRRCRVRPDAVAVGPHPHRLCDR